jgi:chaperonin cofactor prefoldin
MKSNTSKNQITKLQKELDEVDRSIDNYFEGDNSEHFGEEYYRNLMNRKEELEKRISKL